MTLPNQSQGPITGAVGPATSSSTHAYGHNHDHNHEEVGEEDALTACPITMCVMEEPALLLCGHSFEKAALLQALERSRVCPGCRDFVPLSFNPVPNDSLRSV